MISVRGSGAAPTTAARAGLGVRAFMKAALGVRFLAGAAVLAAAAVAGAFLAVAMLGLSLLGWVVAPAKTCFSTGSGDANGKKSAFQAGACFFCFAMLQHGHGGTLQTL